MYKKYCFLFFSSLIFSLSLTSFSVYSIMSNNDKKEKEKIYKEYCLKESEKEKEEINLAEIEENAEKLIEETTEEEKIEENAEKITEYKEELVENNKEESDEDIENTEENKEELAENIEEESKNKIKGKNYKMIAEKSDIKSLVESDIDSLSSDDVLKNITSENVSFEEEEEIEEIEEESEEEKYLNEYSGGYAAAHAALLFAGSDEDIIPYDGEDSKNLQKDELYCYKVVKTEIYRNDPYYASCDRAVGAAYRWSGADITFPAGNVKTIDEYFNSSSKWRSLGAWEDVDLKPGDILIDTGKFHVKMYLGNGIIKEKYPNSESNMFEASLYEYFPRVFNDFPGRTKAKYIVYRLVSPDNSNKYYYAGDYNADGDVEYDETDLDYTGY